MGLAEFDRIGLDLITKLNTLDFVIFNCILNFLIFLLISAIMVYIAAIEFQHIY